MGENCPKCGSELREESRRWGSVVKCPCGYIRTGYVSSWASEQMHQPRTTPEHKADNLSDAVAAAGGWHQPTTTLPVRELWSGDDLDDEEGGE